MTKENLAELVRGYAATEEPTDLAIIVHEEQIHRDESRWYVPVSTNPDTPKRFRYYEKLVDIETHLEERDQVRALLIPAGANL